MIFAPISRDITLACECNEYLGNGLEERLWIKHDPLVLMLLDREWTQLMGYSTETFIA